MALLEADKVNVFYGNIHAINFSSALARGSSDRQSGTGRQAPSFLQVLSPGHSCHLLEKQG